MATGIERRIGVVLCGGESSRMGRDKGLLLSGDTSWAGRAAELLRVSCARVLFSIRSEQRAAYGFEAVLMDKPEFAGRGPLGGLLSAHADFPDSDILLLACDMISIEAADIAPLTTGPGEIVAYRDGELFEPLCAFYSAAALRKIAALFQANALPNSLQKILRLPQFSVTALAAEHRQRLLSQNTPL